MRKEIQKIVHKILTEDEKARCDDIYLTARVLEYFNASDRNGQLIKRLDNWHRDGLPNIHTVIRARQKIQADHPELVNKKTYKARKAAERQYREEYGRNA